MKISQSRSDPVIQELIRLVFEKFSKKGKDQLSKKQILKILFLVKEQLPDDNPIKHKLAYYWYKNGPSSQVFYDNFDDLVLQSLITLAPNDQNLEIYTFAQEQMSNRLAQHDNAMQEATFRLIKEISQYNNLPSMLNHIYREYAPSLWYEKYNLGFKNKFEVYCSYVLNEEKNNSINRYENTEILYSLYETVSTIPVKPAFNKFRNTYFDFAKMLSSLLLMNLPFENKKAFTVFQKLCDDIWNVFALGVRLVAHDEYYDMYIPQWEQQYLQELKKLRSKLDETVREFKETITDDNTRFTEEIESKIESIENNSAVQKQQYTPSQCLDKINDIVK